MGQRIGVLLGDGVEQQELQGLMVRKGVQAVTEKLLLLPVPVTGVDAPVLLSALFWLIQHGHGCPPPRRGSAAEVVIVLLNRH